MSNDLISRKEILERINYYYSHTNEESSEHYAYGVVLKEINELPTAFDKEKVKEELTAGKFITIGGDTVGKSVNIRVDRAVEIVEKGGIE